MLLDLDVDRLTLLDVHEMQWCSAHANHFQVGLVGRVVKSLQFAIINAEPILPQMQDAFLRLATLRGSGSLRIRNATALNSVTA